jgi:hypothetical protein
MENLTVELVINGINAAGTLLLGISAVIGIPKIVSGLAVKNETLYGEEAIEWYSQIKEKLSKGRAMKLPTIKSGGGRGLIVPRLELRKITYNGQTMGDDWKGRRAAVRFFIFKIKCSKSA